MDKGTDYKNILVILDITYQTWKNIYVQWHILRIEKPCIIITKFIPYTKQFKQYYVTMLYKLNVHSEWINWIYNI